MQRWIFATFTAFLFAWPVRAQEVELRCRWVEDYGRPASVTHSSLRNPVIFVDVGRSTVRHKISANSTTQRAAREVRINGSNISFVLDTIMFPEYWSIDRYSGEAAYSVAGLGLNGSRFVCLPAQRRF
jgi:hypothetical protein